MSIGTRCSTYMEGKKAALGAGLHLPLCVRQGSFVSTTQLTTGALEYRCAQYKCFHLLGHAPRPFTVFCEWVSY